LGIERYHAGYAGGGAGAAGGEVGGGAARDFRVVDGGAGVGEVCGDGVEFGEGDCEGGGEVEE